MDLRLKPAPHRQTRYAAAPPLDPPEVLGVPAVTDSLDQARTDLAETGLCIYRHGLAGDALLAVRDAVTRQAEAERALGDLAPAGALTTQQQLSNLVNKGALFTDLVLREEVDELAGFMLGPNFLISSITAGIFHGPTDTPQPLHRDQGQVPATADFPAACNVFWLLDDFAPQHGSTWVVPGSHRWPAGYQIEPPPRDVATQITAPAGAMFVFDGRIWHGYVANFLCLPWMRQQENWGVTCLQSVIDAASDKLKRRLGLRTYGTLGMMSGTRVDGQRASLGNYDVVIPDYIIGAGGELHPMRRAGDANR